ncbi:hypothetical protein H8356DRAFT_1357573 [Neocallimastix lanati (nom. inval.)]|nr:hypothetical protein H8356DRAFT_1357573 [Neocallimastix sp. JGI-2020a]
MASSLSSKHIRLLLDSLPYPFSIDADFSLSKANMKAISYTLLYTKSFFSGGTTTLIFSQIKCSALSSSQSKNLLCIIPPQEQWEYLGSHTLPFIKAELSLLDDLTKSIRLGTLTCILLLRIRGNNNLTHRILN